MFSILDGNPRSVILDRHFDRIHRPVSNGAGRDPNHTVIVSVSDRVRHQIRNDLFDSSLIERQSGSPRVQFEINLDSALFE